MKAGESGTGSGRAGRPTIPLPAAGSITTRPADWPDRTDEDLIDHACEGDTRAFAIVVDRHAGAAFSLAIRICGNRAMAEEVVQEAFLSLWRTLERYDRHRGSFRSLLLSAVHHRAIDALRRESSRTQTVSDDCGSRQIEEPLQTAEEIERRDEARDIQVALGSLPDEQRQVIELAYFHGLSQSQIAEQLGLAIGTVKGRVRLGLAKLRSTMSVSP
jgi:RNA polymerase sigma-70 factor (ECF subfamily)